jgi:hypothetical protein
MRHFNWLSIYCFLKCVRHMRSARFEATFTLYRIAFRSGGEKNIYLMRNHNFQKLSETASFRWNNSSKNSVLMNCGRFANESFRQLSVRQCLRSIRQRSSTFLCQFANVTYIWDMHGYINLLMFVENNRNSKFSRHLCLDGLKQV